MDSLTRTLFDLSPAGSMLLRPVFDKQQHLTDFAFAYLNPVAQQLLLLPAEPTQTFWQLYAHTQQTGVFNFYHDAFQTGQVSYHKLVYTYEGLYGVYHLAAQRNGDQLVVTFTDSPEQRRGDMQAALARSQEREHAALAEAERQRRELQRIFELAPVAIAVYRGPENRIELANPTVCQLWGRQPAQLLGRGLFEALPEVAGMGYEELLDQVRTTGEPHVAHEMAAHHDREGRRDTVYWNFVYLALPGEAGHETGVMVVAIEVTEQVVARQHIERLNEQLATANEELSAANEELLASNEELLRNNVELLHTQHELQALSHELEARVTQRTHEARQAQHEAELGREQLKEQQDLLRQILGQVPAAIATLTGPEHRFSYANDQQEKLLGQTLLGRAVAELLPEEAAQHFVALLDQVYATGQPYRGVEAPIVLPNLATGQPEQRYIDFVYQPLRDRQQQLQAILSFAIDTTERVLVRQRAEALQAELLAAAQHQAQERENLYRVFEQAPAAIALLRESDHRIAYLNAAYKQLLPGEPALGRTVQESQPALAAQGFVAILDRVFKTGEAQFGHETPLDLSHPAGPRRQYVNFTYQAYRENGQIAGVSVFAFEVTEEVLARQAAEQQQAAQRAELQRIFEQAPVAIAVLRGPEFVVELANERLRPIWGQAPDQAIGKPYFEVVPDLAGQGFEAVFTRVLTSGEPFVATEAPMLFDRTHTGRPGQGYINFTLQPLYDAQQHITGLVAVGVEVTDQVHARQQVQDLNEELAAINEELQVTNEELNSSNTQLTRTNADLDTFVYTASHDLKAPIANIEGLLLALRQELPAELLRVSMLARILTLMDDAVARFQQTIAHLTTITQLQQAGALPTEAVDLAALIEAVRLDLAPALEASAAELRVDAGECSTVQFAPKNLRSIVYNLLSNALKYRSPDRPPRVHLRAYCTTQQVVLTVQDNGLGLSTEQQRKLFQLFKRLHPQVEGSGVGLYTVKKIIDNVGGTITVQSTLGVGTTFTITLPR